VPVPPRRSPLPEKPRRESSFFPAPFSPLLRPQLLTPNYNEIGCFVLPLAILFRDGRATDPLSGACSPPPFLCRGLTRAQARSLAKETAGKPSKERISFRLRPTSCSISVIFCAWLAQNLSDTNYGSKNRLASYSFRRSRSNKLSPSFLRPFSLEGNGISQTVSLG